MLPVWLFDELADHVPDRRELAARARAWAELLDGAQEVEPIVEPTVTCSRFNGKTTYEMTSSQAELLRDYETLRPTTPPAFGVKQRSGFWASSGVSVKPDETHYLTPARAAELANISTQKLAALRRRGELRSIGLTLAEYARAREAAGWADGGWGPDIFYLREDIEALAERRLWR